MNEEELLKVLNKEKSYTEEDLLLFIYDLRKENARLKDKNKKAIEKLEFYNSGEALWYVPIQEIIDILKEN